MQTLTTPVPVETKLGTLFIWVDWPERESGEECTAYYGDSLIRVTNLDG